MVSLTVSFRPNRNAGRQLAERLHEQFPQLTLKHKKAIARQVNAALQRIAARYPKAASRG